MKRARFLARSPARFLLALLAMLLLPPAARAQESPLAWANALRRTAGAAAVQPDPLLSETAHFWAVRLAAAGVLSHRGTDGSTALDRYRSLGGTEVRVGEILGAGARLGEIERAWERSESHRNLALRSYWTHIGWGRGFASGKEVWVVLFCQRLVEGLSIGESADCVEIAGRFLEEDARNPFLLSGIERLTPASWEPGSRSFLFRLPRSRVAGYLRLGYGSADGGFSITNAFTWPRGKESPGAAGRFPAPAASP